MKTPRTYPASVVCRSAGINDMDLNPNTLATWRKGSDPLLQLDDPDQSGWTRYTLADLVRVCALAELSRLGLPTRGLLFTELETELRELIGLHGSHKAPVEKPRYLIAEQILTSGRDGKLGVSRGNSSVASRIGMLSKDDHDCATAIVIDTAKLARRIRRRFFDALGAELPGEESK